MLPDDPFKDDPFGKADVAGVFCYRKAFILKGSTTVSQVCFALSVSPDPFGGDPFKGSDPFAADSFFAQTSKAAFSPEDPFSASAGPFAPPTSNSEPDLFASKPSEPAAPPPAAAAAAAAPDLFAFKPTATKDPFLSAGNKTADSDPFGGQTSAAAEADPFGAQDGGADPFSSSSSNSDLAAVSRKKVAFRTKVELTVRFRSVSTAQNLLFHHS